MCYIICFCAFVGRKVNHQAGFFILGPRKSLQQQKPKLKSTGTFLLNFLMKLAEFVQLGGGILHLTEAPTRSKLPRILCTVYNTPRGRFSKVDCSANQEGTNIERYVSGKLSARCFQRRPSWRRHYSNHCGDINHRKRPRGV